MKTPAVALAFICAVTCMTSSSPAQITITAADVTAQLAVGDTLINKIDRQTSSLNIGLHGATSWDFSLLRTDSVQTLIAVAPSGTPFFSRFPGATHAFQASLIVSYQGNPIPATGYLYFQLAGDFKNLGLAADVANGGATLTGFNQPADLFYKLPSTYGTTWTSTFLDTTDVILNGLGILLSHTGVWHHASYVVDAYGPMTIPGGSVHNALRIKKTDSTSAKFVSYIFLAKDGALVQATAANLSQPDTGTIQVSAGSVSWNAQVGPLPIQLVSFNASPEPGGAGVLVSWSTQSEVNNYGFEVQRGTGPDAGFSSIPGGFVAGHGTTTLPRQYSFTDRNAPGGISYYRLKQLDLDGAIHYSDPAKVEVSPVGAAPDVPAEFSLSQNFPNPFNPGTTIRYALPVRTIVSLAVYNTLGERVAVLVQGEQEAGVHEAKFDGAVLASGVYFYRLESPGFVQTRKLSLVR